MRRALGAGGTAGARVARLSFAEPAGGLFERATSSHSELLRALSGGRSQDGLQAYHALVRRLGALAALSGRALLAPLVRCASIVGGEDAIQRWGFARVPCAGDPGGCCAVS